MHARKVIIDLEKTVSPFELPINVEDIIISEIYRALVITEDGEEKPGFAYYAMSEENPWKALLVVITEDGDTVVNEPEIVFDEV